MEIAARLNCHLGLPAFLSCGLTLVSELGDLVMHPEDNTCAAVYSYPEGEDVAGRSPRCPCVAHFPQHRHKELLEGFVHQICQGDEVGTRLCRIDFD